MNALNTTTVRRRFRRQVTSFMLVLSLSMGVIAATPTPAHAAGSYVVAQFQMTGRFAIPSCFCGSDVASAWAELQLWTGSTWYPLGYYQLNEVGSFGWNTSGYYFRIRVNHTHLMSPWVIFGPGYPTFQQTRVFWY